MQTLTKKQKQVLDFIQSFIKDHGHAPSYEEIAQGLGLSSPSNIYVHVENLRIKGYLKKKWNANRSIDLTATEFPKQFSVEVKLAGRIAAGFPIEAIEDQETISIPADLLGKNETFVLKVNGESMRDDHIIDGDLIIVEKRENARNGEMVVALIKNSEAILKRFYREKNKIRLEPANPVYPTQVYNENDVQIQGVVVGVLRKYK